MTVDYDWTPDLWEGEAVLWQGRPAQPLYVFSWNDFILALFIVKSFEWAVEDKSASRVSVPEALNPYLVIFCIVLMCVVIWKRLLADRRRRSREIYAITNIRAIVANSHSRRLEGSMPLSNDLNAFKAGLSYRCVVFTKTRRITWRLSQGAFQGMWIDGPPDVLGSHSDGSLYFLALVDADTVLSTVASRIGTSS